MEKVEFVKVNNFSAGPAILPQEVFEEASEAVLDFQGIGMSILEISHRSKEFQSVMDEAVSLAKELLAVPNGYEVLFLQGGASTQFLMAAMNLLGDNDTAGYVETGSWSAKAIKEAKLYGHVNILASSKDDEYAHIPKGYDIPGHLKYLHLTSNNTIFGTQFHEFPKTAVPIIADMSSDIFSRTIDVDKFGIIYAGAQKNMGPAGTCIAIVNKEFVAHPVRTVPTMLDYNTHIAKGSMFNTPPVFAVYVSMLTMRWVKKNGGVSHMAKANQDKADLIYNYLDNSNLFYGRARKEDRSKMNVVFLIKNQDLTDSFLGVCARAGCSGIKGHRSVGGFRASIYNAMNIDGVQTLVDVMSEFERTHG